MILSALRLILAKPSEMFRKNLKNFLEAKGWTQADLARAMLVKPQMVNKYFTENVEPRIDSLAAIATALGIKPHELLMDDTSDVEVKESETPGYRESSVTIMLERALVEWKATWTAFHAGFIERTEEVEKIRPIDYPSKPKK